MTTYTFLQIDPSPKQDRVVAERFKFIARYLESFVVGQDDRLVFHSTESRQDPVALQAEIRALAPQADFILTMHEAVPAETIALAPKLQLIQKLGHGPEGIDVSAAADRNIPVAVLPHYGAVSVSEHTMLLMLALSRKLVKLHQLTVAGFNPQNFEPTYTTQWNRRFNWMEFPGDEFVVLSGKTLGIIGLGEIATGVAKRAAAFDMKILYAKRTRLSPQQEAALGVTFVSLDELLKQSDYVTLHVTHNQDTEKFIGARELGLMKPTAFLVNTSRGNVIDQNALVEALRAHKIAGAGLDVFSFEPLPADDPLLALDNVILTPHIAAYGPPIARYTEAFENCKRVLAGLPPRGLIDSNGNHKEHEHE